MSKNSSEKAVKDKKTREDKNQNNIIPFHMKTEKYIYV